MFYLSNTTVLTAGSSMLVQGRSVSIFLSIEMPVRSGDSSEESVLEQIIGLQLKSHVYIKYLKFLLCMMIPV